jgi:hypothetical protein
MTLSSPQQNDTLNLRPATPADVAQILAFIHDLAEYEREPNAVHATEDDLLRDGFGPNKRFDCLIAEWDESGTSVAVGFALYFHNYSTWPCRRSHRRSLRETGVSREGNRQGAACARRSHRR